MILTKQLQVVIESSLAQGRDYEDVREILLKQGFQDADISELFSQYRGAASAVQQSKVVVEPVVTPLQTQTQTSDVTMKSKDILFNKDFVHPEVKKGFVPVGFEDSPSPQANVQEDIQKFMNVGTNTQTAGDSVMREEAKIPAQKLPAPGTTLLPSEMPGMNASSNISTPASAPKVLEETGLVKGEVAQQVVQETPQVIDTKDYINVGFAGMPEMEKVLAEEQAKKIEKSPWPLVFVLIFLIALMGGAYYWFFILNPVNVEPSETDRLLQELQNENSQQAAPQAPPAPTGPVDPFTNMPLETN